MGGRDHSFECAACGFYRGGLNDLHCECDLAKADAVAAEQADASRALIDALIYQKRDFDHAWDRACAAWDRWGEAPARIGLLEAALMEACEIASSPGGAVTKAQIARIAQLLAIATGK